MPTLYGVLERRLTDTDDKDAIVGAALVLALYGKSRVAPDISSRNLHGLFQQQKRELMRVRGRFEQELPNVFGPSGFDEAAGRIPSTYARDVDCLGKLAARMLGERADWERNFARIGAAVRLGGAAFERQGSGDHSILTRSEYRHILREMQAIAKEYRSAA